MNEVLAAAIEVQESFRRRGWSFCIIGGIAVARWGQPRVTQDVDVSLLVELGQEEAYIDAILASFSSRFADARKFAIENRVLLATASNDVALDIVLASFPYEQQVIERASGFQYAPGVNLVTASAEDLVVYKAFAGRDQDWSDVKGIVIRLRDQLDWFYIESNLSALCEIVENTDALDRLREIRAS